MAPDVALFFGLFDLLFCLLGAAVAFGGFVFFLVLLRAPLLVLLLLFLLLFLFLPLLLLLPMAVVNTSPALESSLM